MNTKFSIASALLLLTISANSFVIQSTVTINCEIGPVQFNTFGELNACTVEENANVTESSTQISIPGAPFNDVKVFYAKSNIIRYIPKNLASQFNGLTGIRLVHTQLESVTSCDLVNFPELTMFASVNNNVEFLEPNLFKYNPKVEYVTFRNNKLSYIYPTVFNPIVPTLRYLTMYGQKVVCGLGSASTPQEVAKLIAKIPSSHCADPVNQPDSYIKFMKNPTC